MKVFLAIFALLVALPSALAQQSPTIEDRLQIYSLALLDLTTKELSSNHFQSFCVKAAPNLVKPKELKQLIEDLQKSSKKFTSQAGCIAKRGAPVYTKHGQPAVLLDVGRIEQTSPTQVKVNAGYFAAPEGAAENMYLMEKLNNQWVIVKQSRLWISLEAPPFSTYPLPNWRFNSDAKSCAFGALQPSACGAG